MDYHSIGFRECLAEVASYLVKFEGMDVQDPLRLRLMSHLQCYSAQRELALKSASNHAVWNPSAFTAPVEFSGLGTSPTVNPVSSTGDGMSLIGQVASSSHYNNTHLSANDSNSLLTNSTGVVQTSSHMMPPPPPPPPPPSRNPTSSSSPTPTQTGLASYSANGMHNITQMNHAHHHPHHSPLHQYFPTSYGPTPSGSMQYQSNAPGVKYCRPWGAELAY